MAAKPRTKAGKEAKVKTVMHEWGQGKLPSGSKKGPVVKSQKQAVAIALNQAGQSKPPGKRKSLRETGGHRVGNARLSRELERRVEDGETKAKR